MRTLPLAGTTPEINYYSNFAARFMITLHWCYCECRMRLNKGQNKFKLHWLITLQTNGVCMTSPDGSCRERDFMRKRGSVNDWIGMDWY